jgi:hypothetical protein
VCEVGGGTLERVKKPRKIHVSMSDTRRAMIVDSAHCILVLMSAPVHYVRQNFYPNQSDISCKVTEVGIWDFLSRMAKHTSLHCPSAYLNTWSLGGATNVKSLTPYLAIRFVAYPM